MTVVRFLAQFVLSLHRSKMYFLLIIAILSQGVSCIQHDTDFDQNVVVHVTDGMNSFIMDNNNNDVLMKNCPPSGNWTFIIHGWGQNRLFFWILRATRNFLRERGGCVFVVDYSYYCDGVYLNRPELFNGIQGEITKKYELLETLGYSPDNGFIFGFSFGAILALESAYKFGPQKIRRVDTCDPPRPGFNMTSEQLIHAKDAAQEVQCMHTSRDIGTPYRFCQWDWNLGICGWLQPAAWFFLPSSHMFCPEFYNSAFMNDFAAMPKPMYCLNETVAPDPTTFNHTAVMGFRFDTKNTPRGEYYAATKWLPPYNLRH